MIQQALPGASNADLLSHSRPARKVQLIPVKRTLASLARRDKRTELSEDDSMLQLVDYTVFRRPTNR